MNTNSPPKFITNILRSVCPDYLFESIVGDLEEQFYDDLEAKNVRQAKFRYCWNAIRFIRPEIIIRNELKIIYNIMLYNYFKIAIRNIKKHRLFSFINVFGLSFSLAICLIIIMMLADQYSYDSFNTHSDRVYRINHTRSDMDNVIAGMATTPMPLGEELTSKYPGVEDYTRLYRGFGNGWVKLMQDVNIPLSGFFADPNVFETFQYEFAQGNSNSALAEPYSVVLTHETAEKLFNDGDVMGQTIKVGNLGSYKVTGVLKKMEGKSHIKFDGLASISTIPSLEKLEIMSEATGNWRNQNRCWTYLKLEDDTSIAEVESNLALISENQYANMEDREANFFLQNIRDISPGPLLGNQIGPGIPMIFVYFLAGLALVIIISACFNYTNLSIARSLNRAREVGIRKVFGAVRSQIFLQFLMESIVISLFAFGFSLVIVELLKPVFLNLNFSQLLDWNLKQSIGIYGLCLAFAVFVGILAGLLPSIFHSSVKAISALHNLSGVKVFSKMGLRKLLIVAQFSLSLFLVITVKLIYNQMGYMVDKDYGFDADNNVVIRLNNTSAEKLKTELLSYSNIESVAAAGFVPASGVSSESKILDYEDEKTIHNLNVDEDYVENMGLKVIAGNGLRKNFREEKMIINEKAVPHLGFVAPLDAIGQTITLSDSIKYEIIGVLEDYHHETLLSEIRPLALVYDPSQFAVLQVKVNSSNFEDAMANIDQAWATVNPMLKMEYKLLADEISFFADIMFGDLTKIIAFVSFLAIVIACLGLMGMVVFSTQVRLKEVSIRKVLGASDQMLVFLLSKGFLKMLGIAILVSTPLSWFINDLWMQFIAFRVDIGFEVLLFGVSVISFFGILVIASQTLKTAQTNPSEVLRNE